MCRCKKDYWSEYAYYVWSCMFHWNMCKCKCHTTRDVRVTAS